MKKLLEKWWVFFLVILIMAVSWALYNDKINYDDNNLILSISTLALLFIFLCRQTRLLCLIRDIALIQFESVKCGYVSMDNWGDIQANTFLKEMVDNAKSMNGERKNMGLEDIQKVDLMHGPVYDKAKNQINYAVKFECSGVTYFNTVVLLLTRYGFERIILITGKNNHERLSSQFKHLFSDHRFPIGSRYQDFVEGDKVSSLGNEVLVSLKTSTIKYGFEHWSNFLKSYRRNIKISNI